MASKLNDSTLHNPALAGHRKQFGRSRVVGVKDMSGGMAYRTAQSLVDCRRPESS